MEVGAGRAGEEVSLYLGEVDLRVKVDAVLFEAGFLLEQYRHELPEKLAEGVEAPLPSFHIVEGVAHGEEYGLYAACPWGVVHIHIALGGVADGNDGRCGLEIMQGFLEALQSADTAENEVFAPSEAVAVGQSPEEGGSVP